MLQLLSLSSIFHPPPPFCCSSLCNTAYSDFLPQLTDPDPPSRPNTASVNLCCSPAQNGTPSSLHRCNAPDDRPAKPGQNNLIRYGLTDGIAVGKFALVQFSVSQCWKRKIFRSVSATTRLARIRPAGLSPLDQLPKGEIRHRVTVLHQARPQNQVFHAQAAPIIVNIWPIHRTLRS